MTGAQGDPIIQLAAPQQSPSRDSKGFSRMKGPLLIVRFTAPHNVQIDLQPHVKYLKQR